MNKKAISFILLGSILLAILMVSFDSCGTKDNGELQEITESSYVSTINSPMSGGLFVQGEKMPFNIEFSDNGKTVVKLDVFLNDINIYTSKEKKSKLIFDIPTDTIQLGPHTLKIDVELTDGMVEKYELTIIILSKVVPETFTYKVVNKYPHDVNAYTQGLIYENGYMYEGTGQEGKSELRLVDFKQNKILKSQKLPNDVFGEGIAIVGNKIYQLSWQDKRVFVYDKSSFKLLNEFSYPTEGWGLTYDGTNLILSDGTPTIYFYDPATFTLKRKIVVVDNLSTVGLLNELEYINGEIWANVYQTNIIVRINPLTGCVNSNIDLIGLLTDQEQMQHTDVLNGIAFDSNNGKTYLTGKLWPWLFEVELLKSDLSIK